MGIAPYRRSTSAGNFAIYRDENGKTSPVTIPVYNVERKQSRSFVQSKPVSWVARGYVPCGLSRQSLDQSPETESLAGQGQSPCQRQSLWLKTEVAFAVSYLVKIFESLFTAFRVGNILYLAVDERLADLAGLGRSVVL